MLDRARAAVTSQPWRTAAVALALGLVGSMIALVMVSGGDEAGNLASDSTTTTAPPSTTLNTFASTTISAAPGDPEIGTFGGTIAIKVDNALGARPQWGIGDVPLLVEFPVEGGVTRFTALINRGESGLIGPVRSLRPTDADLVPALAPVVVSSGGREFVMREVDATGLFNVVAAFSAMFVSVGNPDPFDTFVDLEVLETILPPDVESARGLPAGGFPEDGDAANEIILPFEGVSYVYERESGYVRLDGSDPFEVLDRSGSNPAPLSHDVIVVMSVAERSAGYVDVNGIEVSAFDVVGGGELLVTHGGRAIEGTWSRNAIEDPFEFRDSTGASFGLPEGRVYLAIVPRDGEVSYR